MECSIVDIVDLNATKSKSDKKSYRLLKFSSGFEALLISSANRLAGRGSEDENTEILLSRIIWMADVDARIDVVLVFSTFLMKSFWERFLCASRLAASLAIITSFDLLIYS